MEIIFGAVLLGLVIFSFTKWHREDDLPKEKDTKVVELHGDAAERAREILKRRGV